jgi:hypothetical protein
VSRKVVLPQAVYRRIREPRALPDGLKLRALEWALYFAVNGTHSAAELGRQLRADPAERDEALTRLASLGLVDEREIDATEYVRALASAGERDERTLREFLIGVAQRPESPVVASPPNESEARAKIALAFSEPSPLRPVPTAAPLAEPMVVAPPEPAPRPSPQAVPVPASGSLARPVTPRFGFKPLPPPDDVIKENRPMPASRRLSLRALMNLIETQAGSREAGQLDIYRVFVRVDTSLLKRNGIETLRFTEDHLVSDPELEQALVKSVKKTLGLNCPESIWVELA